MDGTCRCDWSNVRTRQAPPASETASWLLQQTEVGALPRVERGKRANNMEEENLDINSHWEPVTFNYSGNATNETVPVLTRGERDETLAAVEISVLGVLFFLALTGNSYVLADIYRSRTHHRRMHLFLANLW
ncbi:G-protein coupled receptor [Branchiostoma belcheri]|nr:G-protein coupled receptor [Branchiostoma belcheri]